MLQGDCSIYKLILYAERNRRLIAAQAAANTEIPEHIVYSDVFNGVSIENRDKILDNRDAEIRNTDE